MITIGRDVEVEYEDLLEEHNEIDRYSLMLQELIASNDPNPDSARSLLKRLAHVVEAHLRREESFIYPGLASCIHHADTMRAVTEFEVLRSNWSAYVNAWQTDGALDDWQAFRRHSSDALSQLHEGAMAEISLLYAAGVREGLVKVRPGIVKSRRQASG